jgi:hypothetical protein
VSLPSSANQPTQKPGMNVYTVMLIIAFCALVVACVLLATELSRFGPGVPWSAGGS